MIHSSYLPQHVLLLQQKEQNEPGTQDQRASPGRRPRGQRFGLFFGRLVPGFFGDGLLEFGNVFLKGSPYSMTFAVLGAGL